MPEPGRLPRPRRARRWVRRLLVAAAAVALLMTAVWAAVQTPPVRRLVHARAEAALRDVLGHDVRIGDVRLRPWAAALELRAVRVGGSAPGEPQFTAQTVRLRWRWAALLRRRLVVRDLALVQPALRVIASAERRVPLRDMLSLPLTALSLRTAAGWTFTLEAASLAEGDVQWTLGEGRTVRVEGLEGRWRRLEEPAAGVSANFQAARLTAPLGGPETRLDDLQVQADWTASGLSVPQVRFALAGTRVALVGAVRDLAATPTLDLGVDADLPLPGLLAAGPGAAGEAVVRVAGRLHGPLDAPRFSGEALVRRTGADDHPVRLEAWWGDGRVHAEAVTGSAGNEIRGRLALAPDTAAFLLTVRASRAELATLGAWPAILGARAGLVLPDRLRGRLTVDLDIAGRGADAAALRGAGALRVEDLGVPGDLPPGRLEARLTATARRLTLEAFRLALAAGELRGRGTLDFADSRFHVPLQAEVRDVAPFARALRVALGGHGAFSGVLSGTPGEPRLRGRLAWREPRLGPRRLDLLEGDVELAPRTMTATRLTARIGQTVVRLRGTLTALGRKPLRALDPFQELGLDLAGEAPSGRTADIVEYLPDGLDIQGGFRMQGRVSGPLRALSGELSLQMTDLRTWREVWDRGQGVITLDGGAVAVRQISVRRGGAHVTGEVHEQDGSLRGRFEGDALDLAKMQWLAKTGLAGRAAARAELSGTAREPRIHGKAESADLAFRGVRFGAAEADFEVIGERAVQVDVTSGGRRLRLALNLVADTLEGDLTVTDADLLPFVRLAGGSGEGLQLRGTGHVVFQGPLDDPPAGHGRLDFSHVQLRAHGDVWDTQGTVHADWRRNFLSLDPMRVRSGERELQIHGTVKEGDGADLAVRGEMPLAAGGKLLAGVTPSAGLARVDLRLRGPLFAPEVGGQVTVHGGVLNIPGLPAPLREVEAVVLLDGAHTRVPSWRGRLAEGGARGTAEVVRGAEGFRMTTAFAVEAARADELLAYLRGKGQVTGTLSATGTLQSRGASPADFWPGLSGQVNVLLRDGHMGEHTILARILSLLNVAQILNFRIPDLVSAGMPYQRLAADVAIQDGVARTENLVLDTPAMKVNAVGQVNLVDDTVDLHVGVKPFQTVDSIVTKIPIAGWLLGGREQGVIVASFHVTGQLKEPVVTPLPFKSLGRNIFGIFQRILELPAALTAPFENQPSQPVRPPENSDR